MNKNKQQGMTMIGWGLILAMLGLILLIVMKLWTIYFDEMGVKRAMANVARDPAARTITKDQAWKIMDKQLNIDRISTVKKEHISIEREGNKPILHVEYEVRTNIAANVDAVVFFDDKLPLDGSAAKE